PPTGCPRDGKHTRQELATSPTRRGWAPPLSECTATISAGQLDAVERRMSISEEGSKSTVVATMSQIYDTTVEDLWDALTSKERLPRWFAPVSGDLRLGGQYQIEGNAGGTIEECEPPSGFRITWEFGDRKSTRLNSSH